MPVKVRCPGCEKVLNAPDAARGRSVKCPECQTKVPVPAEGAAAPAKAGAKPGAKLATKKKLPPRDDEDFLKGLDLSKSEDRSVQICHKCGAKLREEDTRCPKCGLDLVTGETALERRMRGPDTTKFYSEAWSESWKFSKKNKNLVFRTIGYFTGGFTLLLGFLALFFWCYNVPPKAAAGALAAITALTIPGWYWYLTTQIIPVTIEKKSKMPRVRFDFFLSTALGLKLFLWHTAFFAPVLLVGYLVYAIASRSGHWLIGLGIAGGVWLIPWIMFPVVIVHMSMPVTIKAWQIWMISPIATRVLLPSLYCCIIFFVTNLPALGIAGGIGALYGQPVAKTMQELTHRSSNLLGKAYAVYEKENAGKGKAAKKAKYDEKDYPDIPVPDLKPLIVPIIGCYLALLTLGAAAVLNMRAVGLFAQYFKDRLALVTEVAERKYQYKDKKVGEDGLPDDKKETTSADIAKLVAALSVILFMLINGVLYYATGGQRLLMPRFMAEAMGLVPPTRVFPPGAEGEQKEPEGQKQSP